MMPKEHSSTSLLQLALPLWHRVLFVDWHGVLSTGTFWSGVHGRSRNAQVASARRAIWSPSTWGGDWMRGELSTREIVDRTTLIFGGNYREDYAVRAVYQDIRSMPLCAPLVEALRLAARSVPVVIASDNIDLFTPAVAGRSDVRSFAYCCLSSAELNVLKAEDPVRFFAPVLEHLRLGFPDSILLDDSDENCMAFERAGGTAFLVQDGDEAAALVNRFTAPGGALISRAAGPEHPR